MTFAEFRKAMLDAPKGSYIVSWERVDRQWRPTKRKIAWINGRAVPFFSQERLRESGIPGDTIGQWMDDRLVFRWIQFDGLRVMRRGSLSLIATETVCSVRKPGT